MIRSWWSILLTSQADLFETWQFSVWGWDAAAPPMAATDLPLLQSAQHFPLPVPPGNRTCPEWDAFPSPGPFSRMPKSLAQGPISLLTLEQQYLHPRASWPPLTSRPPSLSIILYSSFQTIQYSLGYSYYYQVAGIVKVGVVRSLAFIPFFCITIHVYKLLIMLLAFINSKQGGRPFLTLCKW